MRGSFIQSDTVTKPKILLVSRPRTGRGFKGWDADASTCGDFLRYFQSWCFDRVVKEYNDAILQDDYTSAARAFQKSADQADAKGLNKSGVAL